MYPVLPSPEPPPAGGLAASDDGRPTGEPPVTVEEIRRSCWHRGPAEREPAPRVGERLLLRRRDWATPEPATVAAVQDMDMPGDGWGGPDPDPHVWDGAGKLLPDPWPWITLTPDTGPATPVTCKEARVRGGAGWLRPGSRWDTTGGQT
jgi:hypothetical protein